jgi:hypothetical protein
MLKKCDFREMFEYFKEDAEKRKKHEEGRKNW